MRTSRKVHVSRRGVGRTCLLIVCSCVVWWVQCNDRDWKRVSACCCSVTLLLWSDARKCCSSQVFPCVAQRCYLWNMRHTTRWLWYGLGRQSTLRITESDTTRMEIERVLVRLVDTSSLGNRLYRVQKTNTHHPVMDRPNLVLSLHVQHTLFLSPHFLHCSCEQHLTRRIFTVNYMHTHGSSLGSHLFHPIHASYVCVIWCVGLISSTTPLSSPSSSSSLLLSCPSFCPSTSSFRMCWTNSLCTSVNEDLDTLVEYDPLTGYGVQRLQHHGGFWTIHPGILDRVRVPQWLRLRWRHIGKTHSDTCRRRADHSQEEGLSSCLSSSISHGRTGRSVVKPFDSQIWSVQEIQRHSSESEQN